MNEAYIGIGSNLDPVANIRKSLPAIRRSLDVTGTSRFYRNPAFTPASRIPPPPAFVNGVLRVRTRRSPHEIKFDILRVIEQEAGRRRTADRYAPRSLDLDLLVYGDLRIRTRDLELPDPDLLLYPFWAVPMADLAPDRVLPGAARPLKALAGTMDTTGWAFEESLTRCVRMQLGLPNGRESGACRNTP